MLEISKRGRRIVIWLQGRYRSSFGANNWHFLTMFTSFRPRWETDGRLQLVGPRRPPPPCALVNEGRSGLVKTHLRGCSRKKSSFLWVSRQRGSFGAVLLIETWHFYCFWRSIEFNLIIKHSTFCCMWLKWNEELPRSKTKLTSPLHRE